MKMVRKGTPAIISGSEPLMKPGVCAHDPIVGVIVMAMLRQQSSTALPLQSVRRCLDLSSDKAIDLGPLCHHTCSCVTNSSRLP